MRFDAFNNLKGGYEQNENHKVMLFLRALGPKFRDWVENKGMNWIVAGFGSTWNKGDEVDFLGLKQDAELAWARMVVAFEQNGAEVSRILEASATEKRERQEQQQRKRQRLLEGQNEELRNVRMRGSNFVEPEAQQAEAGVRIANTRQLPLPHLGANDLFPNGPSRHRFAGRGVPR
jgi:hypothetical protein